MHEKLIAILAEMAGECSMLWEHVERAGTFQSASAHEIIGRVAKEIEELYEKEKKHEKLREE